LVTRVYQALLDALHITKQSFSCRHYQVELGNENKILSILIQTEKDGSDQNPATLSTTPPQGEKPMTQDELLEEIQQAKREQVEELDLSESGLTELPPEIGQLSQLRELVLFGNQLTKLPPEIGQLSQLRELYLYGNRLTELPPEIGQLSQLQQLDFEHNQLTQLPAVLDTVAETIEKNIHSLSKEARENNSDWLGLWLENNPLTLPILPEILARHQQPTDILNFYRALQAGSQPLHQAKMLLVGQGGVGKTSLVSRLLHDTYNEQEKTTEGIAIAHCQIATAQGQIHLNIWEFGGQEIMHATHQFFLTRRSLYLLVLDARQGEQESRVEYWLKLIQSFGGNAPILVVVNKSDQHPLDFNHTGLKQKYPTIQAFFDVSCKTGAGLSELWQVVKEQVDKLPHVHDHLPSSWLGVKQQLATMTEDYLSYEKYLEMCAAANIHNVTHQRLLISILHDLGIALNFDDPAYSALRDINILNPEWVTGGVYALLNNRELKDQHGVLAMTQLSRFLDAERYPERKQHLIIEIMEKFELCFAFEMGGKQYLIPELLPKQQPEALAWDYDDNLRFEYHYDVLPSSVISRFITRLHDQIWQKTYWRTGVILENDNNRALVKVDPEDKKLRIWVSGNDRGKRGLLAIIRCELEYIHKSISKIQVTEQVPYRDIMIPYADLLQLEKKGRKTHYIPAIDEEVDVIKLLDGIDNRELDDYKMEKAGELQMLYINRVHEVAQEGIVKEIRVQKYTTLIMMTYFVSVALAFGGFFWFQYGWAEIKQPLTYFIVVAGVLGFSLLPILERTLRVASVSKSRDNEGL
jgi:internalin A